jgi:Fur family ferric uptake transcriptional regulator
MIAYQTLLETFKQLLKENSLKFTRQRESVLKVLYENEGHFTPEDLSDLIKQHYSELTVSIPTIYRTLSLLENSGIVDSISFGAKGKKYELGLKEHHDHLICVQCGKLIEFQDTLIEKRQEEISKQFNFKMTGHTMNITGICESCQNKKQ